MSSAQRRRVAAALARERSDRVPLGELHVDDRLLAGLVGLAGTDRLDAATRFGVLDRLHLDAIGAYPLLANGAPLLGAHLALERAGEPVCHLGVKLGLPDPVGLDWSPVRQASDASPFFVVSVVPGPFGELAYATGIERFLLLAWREPDRARRLAEEMVDYGLELARLAVAAGAEGFVVGEDIAWDGGLLLRASTYRQLFLPALKREVDGLHRLGGPVVLHSDGDLRGLIGDLAATGIDGLHGCVPSFGLDLRSLDEQSGRRLSFWGNLGLDSLDPQRPATLENRVDAALEAASGLAGYVFGTSAGILDASLSPSAVQAAYDRAYAKVVAHAIQGA
jgi:uroporphyrinogen decarboxylase